MVVEDLSTLTGTDLATTPGAEKLWLVDPKGAKYLVLEWTADHRPGAGLTAWSPDARHALFTGSDGDVVFDLNLATGSVHGFAVPHLVAADYTRPSGADVVALSDDPAIDSNGRGGVLRRYSQGGTALAVLANDVNMLVVPRPRWLYAPDGATVFLPGAGGLQLASNAGGKARQFDSIEPATVGCAPVRWWDAHTILVSCDEPTGPRLWLAPDAGTTATALTTAASQNPTSGPDWGSFDAVRTSGGQVFVQRPTACGGVDIASLDAAGHAHQLAVAGSLGIDWLVGVAGNRLAVHSTTTEDCYPRGWFGFYDVNAHTTQQVIRDASNQIGAATAVAFGRQ